MNTDFETLEMLHLLSRGFRGISNSATKGDSPMACGKWLLALAVLAALIPGAARAQFDFEIKLTASDAASDAKFGRTVSLSGDTAIVGTPNNDSAYIFGLVSRICGAYPVWAKPQVDDRAPLRSLRRS